MWLSDLVVAATSMHPGHRFSLNRNEAYTRENGTQSARLLRAERAWERASVASKWTLSGSLLDSGRLLLSLLFVKSIYFGGLSFGYTPKLGITCWLSHIYRNFSWHSNGGATAPPEAHSDYSSLRQEFGYLCWIRLMFISVELWSLEHITNIC